MPKSMCVNGKHPEFGSLQNVVGFHASLFFEKCRKTYIYFRYTFDTFSIFDSINVATAFHTPINFPPSILEIYYGGGE